MQIGVHPVTAVPADVNAVIVTHLGGNRRGDTDHAGTPKCAAELQMVEHQQNVARGDQNARWKLRRQPAEADEELIENGGGAAIREHARHPGEELAGRRAVGQAFGVAARVDQQDALEGLQPSCVALRHQAGDLRQGVQRRAARADPPAAGIGEHQGLHAVRQQAGFAPPVQLAPVHLCLALIAGGEDANVPILLRAGLQRGQVLLPVVAVGLTEERGGAGMCHVCVSGHSLNILCQTAVRLTASRRGKSRLPGGRLQ